MVYHWLPMVYHFTPTMIARIQKSDHKYWQGCVEIKTLLHCWWACKIMQLLWKSLSIPQMIQHSYNRTQHFISLRRNENICPSETCTWIVRAALFLIAKKWKTLKCSLVDNRQSKCTSIHWIDYHSARMRYWHLLQHEGTLKTLWC